MKTCKDCKFFGQPVEHEGVKYGFCFRYPPQALAEGKSSAPVVQSEKTWCGEFKQRPKTRK